MRTFYLSVIVVVNMFFGVASAQPPLEVTVLGSGGPVADNKRASSGYIVSVSGVPKILVDAGAGTFQRLGEAGLPASAIDLILLTHLHIDHTADLPAILKSAYFQKRGDRPISIFGPGGNKGFPSTGEFIKKLFDPKDGLYRYFETFALKVTGTKVNLIVKDIASDPSKGEARTVWAKGGIKVSSIPVRHGPTPAVAYRIETEDGCVTFTGDLNSRSGNLPKLAEGCGLLIYDAAIPENAKGIAVKLHTIPSVIGKAAAKAGTKHLVLSHIMPPAEKNIEKVKKEVGKTYRGKLTVAGDLMKIPATR